MVAKGWSRQFGVDYNETFSPVLRYNSIRTVFALAAEKEFYLYHVDISTAYLNSNLDKEDYIKPPDEFVSASYPDRVLSLKKVRYGLKQSVRSCNTTLKVAIQNVDDI